MIYLTSPNPDLDRLIRQTPPGMMFWSGTCTDPGATCGGCRHYGYVITVRNDAGNAVTTRKRPTACALYHKHMARDGGTLDPKTPACKYHESKK